HCLLKFSRSPARPPGNLRSGHQEQNAEEPAKDALRQRFRNKHASLDPDDGGNTDDGSRAHVHVAVPDLTPRADECCRENCQERRGFGVQLCQPEDKRECRNEETPTADAEQAGEHAAEDADQGDQNDRHARSRTPTTASSTANPYVSSRTGRRCCSAVPASTPNTAGIPTSIAAPGFTSP